MANNYDFRPQVSPQQGISLSDLIASKQTPLTTFAQATPPILQALQQRAAMIQRQQAQQQFMQGMYSPAAVAGQQLDPNTMMAGIRGGILDEKGIIDQSPFHQQERLAKTKEITASANLKQAQADEFKRAAKEAARDGKFLTIDGFGNHVLIDLPGVKAPKGGGIVGHTTIPLTRAQQLEQMLSTLDKNAPDQQQAPAQPGILSGLSNKLFGSKPAAKPRATSDQIQVSYEQGGQTHSWTIPRTPVAIKAAQQKVIQGGGQNFRIGQ